MTAADSGNDQGSGPALRENELNQKTNEKKGGPGESQIIEDEIINDQGDEGRHDPFPRIRLREKRRARGAPSFSGSGEEGRGT